MKKQISPERTEVVKRTREKTIVEWKEDKRSDAVAGDKNALLIEEYPTHGDGSKSTPPIFPGIPQPRPIMHCEGWIVRWLILSGPVCFRVAVLSIAAI